jgi:hypothetical protein
MQLQLGLVGLVLQQIQGQQGIQVMRHPLVQLLQHSRVVAVAVPVLQTGFLNYLTQQDQEAVVVGHQV